ncbi:MAG: hypothetical protein FWH29_05465, partial [Methanobrevibacter sp.]|nr:hypothetical protein [Methanobrevibacter sp.]
MNKIKKYVKENFLSTFFITLTLLVLICSLQTSFAADHSIDNTTSGGILHAVLNNASVVDDSTIYLQNGTYSGTNNTGLTINKNLTFIGNGTVSIDAEGQRRIFNTGYHINVTFINIEFINGNATGSGFANLGGAIGRNYSQFPNPFDMNGAMTFINCRFINNTAGSGGAIDYSYISDFNAINCTFINNTATSTGGLQSSASGGGAIMSNNAGFTNITNSMFINNTAPRCFGGAISHASDGRDLSVVLNVVNSTFISNSAFDRSGAIHFSTNIGYCNVVDSTFINNTASASSTDGNFGRGGAGGAILFYASSDYGLNNTPSPLFSVINSMFINNHAVDGGAIFLMGYNRAHANVVDSTFINNSAGRYGGAIFNGPFGYPDMPTDPSGNIYRISNLTLSNNIMEGNVAGFGQMIYNAGTIGILNLTYLNNQTIYTTLGSMVNVFATLTDDMGNTVTGQNISFYIDGVYVQSMNSDEGYVNIYYIADTLGTVTVTGFYDGHEGYGIELFNGMIVTSDNVTSKIPTNSTIVSNPNPVELGSDIVISGVATDENGSVLANVGLNLTIDGVDTLVFTDSNGFWAFNYTPTRLGTIDVSISWVDGNGTHYGFVNSSSFVVVAGTVDKISTNSTIVSNPNPVELGSDIVISGVATAQDGSVLANVGLNLTIDSVDTLVFTDSNGFWAFNYTPTRLGTIDVNISWVDGNGTHYGFVNSSSFVVVNGTVVKISTNSTIVSNPNPVELGSDIVISGV